MAHYIRKSPGGWTNARSIGPGAVVPLPEYLKVEVLSQQEEQCRFRAIEGIRQDQLFSFGSGQLGFGDPGYVAAAELKYGRREKILRYRRKGMTQWREISAVTHAGHPVPVGKHPIQIPDFPHVIGGVGNDRTPYCRSWFYLKHGVAVPGADSRYLQPGQAGEECIAIDWGDWTELYQFLIRCRSGDNETVGEIDITY
ncbi:MAG: hypothetical protein LBV45_06535 [Xanthomonadaceae bacterium]|jgi:hypothetical protein|nr:hypothetical protein [Xanthomonadaceae bacterium]